MNTSIHFGEGLRIHFLQNFTAFIHIYGLIEELKIM